PSNGTTSLLMTSLSSILRLSAVRAGALTLRSRNTLISASATRRPFSSANDENNKFKSLLPPSNVRSPFADPTRTRVAPELVISASQRRQLSSEKPAKPEEPTNAVPEAESKPVEKVVETPVEKIVEREPVKFVDDVQKASPAATEPADKITRDIEEQYKMAAALPKTGAFRRFKEQWGLAIDDTASDEEKKRQRTTRNTKIGGFFVFGSTVVGFVAFCLYYGRGERDASGHVIKDEYSGKLLAPFYRIVKSMQAWRDYVVEPSREKLLPDPLPAGYIQPKYTIVIEMKNVLVAPEWTYKTGYRFKLRPALDYFLDVLGYPNFEVVIYTSESSMTADPVIHSFDPKQRIMYRLYRDCTKYQNGHHIKDLSRLNRDLSKVIHIDFDPNSFSLHPENVLCVPKWDGDMNDTSLVDLAELLKTIHLSDVEDVRPVLEYYSSFDDPAKEFRKRAIYMAEQETQQKSMAEQGESSSLVKRYTGRLFGFRRHATA
ncbi:hypothetical protein PFISCL1PPCAC_2841, partial [Pristionchus fissidentatus]